MRLSIKIEESNNIISELILKAMLPECKKYMDSSIQKIKNKLPDIIYTSIINSSEYMSLVSGSLRLEFGIPDASSKIDQIINHWISNIQYTYDAPSIKSNKITSKFTASLIKTDFSDVLSLQSAYVNDTERNYSLPWLKWLLLDGTKIIIPSYEVQFGPNPNSRTGNAVMVSSKGSWKVPPEFAGTIGDNWITRAIDNVTKDIDTLLQKALS